MCDCTYTVVTITAAVYEALRPTLNEMSQRLDSIRDDLMKINETLTEQIITNSVHYTCGGRRGWRRAVYLNMTDPNNNCPSGWNMTGYSKRTCGRANSSHLSCDSVFFPVSGGPYSQVCGRIGAYQYGVPDAFYGYNSDGQTTIDSAYVSGVAVMYSSPGQHIWTFANGAWENQETHGTWNYLCDNPIHPTICWRRLLV